MNDDEARGNPDAELDAPRPEETAAAPEPGGTVPGEPSVPGAGPAPHELPRAELEEHYELALAEVERLQDQLLRRQAEMVNYRRRMQKERGELMTVAQAELLEELLPVIDDFERAVENESADARAYHEGMQLILRSVRAVLDRLGVERFDPSGEPFDPQLHAAVHRQPSEEVPAGRILAVYQPGYRLNGRLVRPATVVVSHGGATTEVGAGPAGPAAGEGVGDEDDG